MLTETVIDLADQHTTLYHVDAAHHAPGGNQGSPAMDAAPALPIGSEEEYCRLMRLIVDVRTNYADLCGHPGAILRRLSPGFANNKYWRRLMPHSGFNTHAEDAWATLLPIEALTTTWISFVPRQGWLFHVLPRPRILLYPFGWSTWVSLRLLGPHTIEELADVVEHVCQERCFQVHGQAHPTTLDQFFDRAAEGVRKDAFGGQLTRDVSPSNGVTVTTVLAKYGGSPAIGGLNVQEERTMLRLVRPDRRPPSRPFRDHVRLLSPTDQLEYLLAVDRRRFLWVEHLLRPTDRNRASLRCYHNNTFHALVRAGHLQGLLDAAGKRRLPPPTKHLIEAALEELTTPRYRNASLVEFIRDQSVQRSILAAQQR